MKISALIPIKEHIERIPGKNFKQFAGKPLHLWIISTLLKSKLIDRIYIDTDSKLICDHYKKFDNIQVLKRPARLCGDNIDMNKIIGNSIKAITNEHILQTHVTNPLLSIKTINAAIKRYFITLNANYDSLFSVTVQKKRFYFLNQKPVNHDPAVLLNTQDLEPLLEENSNLYIFSKTSFSKTNSRIGTRPILFSMNYLEAIDIDYLEDFKLAELVAYYMKQNA